MSMLMMAFGSILGLAALGAAGTAALAESWPAALDAKPFLFLHVLDHAGVAPETLLEAQRQVQRIYADIGVQIHWLEADAPAVSAEEAPMLLTVILVPESIAEGIRRGRNVVGLALGSQGAGSRRAYVFTDRVAWHTHHNARRPLLSRRDEGVLLGHVIAHEMGHLMLPRGHTANGIMRARFDPDSLKDAFRGQLLFLPGQGRLIQATLALEASRDSLALSARDD